MAHDANGALQGSRLQSMVNVSSRSGAPTTLISADVRRCSVLAEVLVFSATPRAVRATWVRGRRDPPS